jgi:hypothetical protein
MGGGGGKGGSKAPKSPDYVAAAREQGEQNRKAASELTSANRPTQYDAFGNSINWSKTASSQYTQAQKDLDYWNNFVSGKTGASAKDIKWAKSHQLKDAQSSFDKLKDDPNATWTQNVNYTPETMARIQADFANQDTARANYTNMLKSAPGAYNARGLEAKAWQNPSQYGVNQDSAVSPQYQTSQFGLEPDSVQQFDQSWGDKYSDALYGRVMDRARVEQGRETDSMATKLRQQGLIPGTAAYDRAMQNLMTSHGDVQTLAAQNATIGGYQEARNMYDTMLRGNQQQYDQNRGIMEAQIGADQNLFNQRLSANAGNRDTYRMLQEALQQQFSQEQAANQNALQQYMGQWSGLANAQAMQAGGTYTPTFQGFGTATGYSPADITGALQSQYSSQLGSYNAQNQAKGSMLGAGALFGGSLLGGK